MAYDALSSSSPATATVNDPPAPAAVDKVFADPSDGFPAAVKLPAPPAATVVPSKAISASLADTVLASVKNWWNV